MKELFDSYGFDPASRTIFVFTIVWVCMVIFPSFYLFMDHKMLEKIQKKSILLDWRILIPILVYTILLGYRYEYSYDWDQYMNTFDYMKRGLIYRDDTEHGYLFINRILGDLGFDFYSIFLLEAFMYVSAYCFLLKKDRRYIPFALPLLYISQYSNALNISRQFFAMSVLFIAYRYLLDNKKIRYFIIGGIACTIHQSAIIWIVAFFFFSKLNKYKIKVHYFIIASALCFIVNTFLRDALYGALSSLANLFSLRSDIYGSGGILDEKFLRDDLQPVQIIARLVKFSTYYYLFYKQNKAGIFDDGKNAFLKNYMLIGIISTPLVLLVGTHEIFSRMLYYVSVFYDMGWGILLYNSIFYRKICKINIMDYTLISFCVFQYFWQFYQMILNGFMNFDTNLFIIYE